MQRSNTMAVVKMPTRGYLPQSPLRTLVWFTVLGPPLLALGCWWLSWAWPHVVRGGLWNVAVTMFYPGALLTLVLVGFSLFFYPGQLAVRIRAPRLHIVVLWCVEFLALWHWLNFMSLVFGWLLIWGDRHGPPGGLIAASTAVLAAVIAALTSGRLVRETATIAYLRVVVSLTVVLLLLALPYWLSRLPWLFA